MAKQVEDIVVRLVGEGFEALDKIKGSFRELGKVTNLAEKDILSARDSLSEFAKKAGNTEAVNKGLIEAFKGLRSQTQLCGDAYGELTAEITRLEAVQRGSTAAADRQREALLRNAAAGKQNAAAIEQQIQGLTRLQQQTRPGSSAFLQLGKDIEAARVNLGRFKSEAAAFSSTLNQIPGASLDTLGRQIGRLTQGMQTLKIASDEYLNTQQRISLLGEVRGRTTGRQQVRAANQMFESPQFQSFAASRAANLELPSTLAGIQQRVGEINAELQNVSGYTRRRSLTIELADLNRRLKSSIVDVVTQENLAVDAARRRVNASREINQASGFGAFSSQVAGGEFDPAITTSIRRARERLERENDRLRAAAAEAIQISSTPLLPAAGQTSAPGTGQLISGGARRLRGQVETTFGAGLDEASNTPRAPWQQNYLPNAAVGTAPAVGFAAGAAQAFDNLGRSTDRARRPLRDIFAELERVKGASNGSVNSLQAQISAWAQIRSAVSSSAPVFATATKQIEALSRQQARLEIGGGRRLTGSQLAQGAGAALSGGIFGGPEGLIGGLGGLAVGGVGGAFAGAAAGAQVGMFRQQLAGTADYAASIGKLQIALRGVVGSQSEYDAAIRAAAAATRDLNIPQEEATRGLTRLSAAVIGAGGTVADSSFAFRAMSEAIKATGGNAEQVDGALLALTQVFSKGKVSAEELNQIAERLPGTFTLFAQAAGKTGPELQKALEQGQVGLNDLMKFLELTSKRFGTTALEIAGSTQDAGARLTVAFQAMRLEVGNALQPLGAELQGAFATFIKDITPAVVGSAKAIAAVLSFLTTNDLVAFGVQLTAVSLGFKGLQVAAAALTSLNIASWFTATAVGAKVTSSGMAAATVTTGGLTGAIKALTLAMAKNPLTLLILAGTAAAIKIGSVVLEQKKLNDEVQRSLDIAATAPASGVATEINATENALREARSRLAGGLQGSDFLGFGLIAAEADVARLETKLQKLKTTFKGRVEIETIFKGLGTVPTGYKVINGRLAYLSPGQGYVDAETGKPVGKGRTNFPGGGGEDGGEKAGAALLQAIEQREEALLNLRNQREEQLAQIREQAVEQAKQIETQLADKRLAIERQIQDIQRQGADFIEDSERRIRAASGENPDRIADEQRIADIFREERDSRIDSERRLADDKKQQEETIAEFQRGVAKSINDANRAHTKSMGEIQKQYATSVAKIIDEGTGKAGKRLEKAAQVAAIYIQRSTLNNTILAGTGLLIPERRQGSYDFSTVGRAGVVPAGGMQNVPTFKDVKIPLDAILKLDDTLESLRKGLSTLRAPTSGALLSSRAPTPGARVSSRSTGIGDQFTALLGAEGGYEDVASLKPLPIQRMQQQAARPFLELWKTWESFSNNVFGPSKEEIKRVTKPNPARNQQVLQRIQKTQTAIDNYDPVEAKWKEIDNKLREVKRSKPAVMSAASLVNAVESIYTDLGSTVRKAGGLAVKAGERLGSMLDFSEYASPQQSQVIGKGVREVLGRAYERSIMLGGDKNAFSDAIDQLAPLTRKFGGLIQEVLQIEARKGYAYAEKALPRFRLAPTPAARPEDRRDMMDRLDRMYEQPYITPGIQNRIEGASLPGTSFDVSRLGKTFGEVASASFIGGLLAQNPAISEAARNGQIAQAHNVKQGDRVGEYPAQPRKANPPTFYRLPAIPSAEPTTQLRNTQAQKEQDDARAKAAQQIREAFAGVNAESAQFTNDLNEQLQLLGSQRKYLDMGFSDSLSRDLANLDKALASSKVRLTNIATDLKDRGEDPATVDANYNAAIDKAQELYNISVRLTQALDKQLQDPGAKIRAFIADGTRELNDLASVAIRVSQGIGDAVGNSLATGISGLVEGTTSAKEVFANFLKDVSQILLREATKMIATYIAIGIAKAFAGLSSNFSGGTSSAVPTDAGGWGSSFNTELPGITSIGKIGFAKGGTFTNSIVRSPTLFKFAKGGTTRTGLMGEAGPEAIMPLKRGPDGRLGVDASGMAVPYQRSAATASPLMEAPYQRSGPVLSVPFQKSAGGPAGDSMNAPIEVKFETVRIGGVDYVTREEAEQIGRESAQRGADIAHKRYRNSPSARRAAGFS